jgi:hypothetical protein
MDDPNEDLVIYPLYARLSKEEQESVFTPTPKGKTKVVVSTNIAETSVTIDGITTVIVCAWRRSTSTTRGTSPAVWWPCPSPNPPQSSAREEREGPGQVSVTACTERRISCPDSPTARRKSSAPTCPKWC